IITYVGWMELKENLQRMLRDVRTVAMEFSTEGQIPTVSKVDGGTIQLIEGCGPIVVSSSELIQNFFSTWSEKAYLLHKKAAEILGKLKDAAFSCIRDGVNSGATMTEYDIQQLILKGYRKHGLVTHDPPIVAVNQNASRPHYVPTKKEHRSIKKGDLVLVDIFARLRDPEAVYADITWVGYVGKRVPGKYGKIFNIVKEARDRAVGFIEKKFSDGEEIYGYQVDDIARKVISDQGYGRYFIHRTGHSIDREVHGSGVNIDNLETRDRRRIVPGIGFSIEPGIYFEEFGIRSEINVYMSQSGPEITTGPIQNLITPILK
ncbi:MAG: M24 family metallopeptidase, partial [Fidelibacterota bacterium]